MPAAAAQNSYLKYDVA